MHPDIFLGLLLAIISQLSRIFLAHGTPQRLSLALEGADYFPYSLQVLQFKSRCDGYERPASRVICMPLISTVHICSPRES